MLWEDIHNSMTNKLDVDVSELSSSMNGFLGALHLPPLPSTMNSRFVDNLFYTFGASAQYTCNRLSTWYLYAARQKGEKISQLAENFADKMLQLQVMGQYYYILLLSIKKFS